MSGIPIQIRLIATRTADDEICPIKRVHTTETNAKSSSWQKAPIGIRVSVSKVYVTFFLWYCRQTEG